jgi:hypothetical protein
MADNWSFVAFAYGLAVVVFGGYWRWLGQKERELSALKRSDEPTRTSPLRADPASRPTRP